MPVACSSLLGPVGRTRIVDYFFIRRKNLVVDDLYSFSGRYAYPGGLNSKALIALLLGILPNVPGFLTTIGVVNKESVPFWINDLYNYAWFGGGWGFGGDILFDDEEHFQMI